MSENILVTGSHRSGSTWIGRVLESSGEIDYVHEPFNMENNDEYRTPLKHWYEYVGDDENKKKEFAEYIKKLTTGNLNHAFDKIARHRFWSIPNIIWKEIRKVRRRGRRKVIKDPIALFSADFFNNYLGYRVLVSIRHPAAFAESLKNTNWTHDFTHFLEQDEIMEKIIPQFRDRIEDLIQSPDKKSDIIEQAILLWNIVHSRILYYRNTYPDWIFVKHEELSLDPMSQFRMIFQHLDIEFNETTNNYILTTTGGNSTEGEIRDSRKNISKWSRKLSAGEISRVYEGTREIAAHFYTEEEWFGTI